MGVFRFPKPNALRFKCFPSVIDSANIEYYHYVNSEDKVQHTFEVLPAFAEGHHRLMTIMRSDFLLPTVRAVLAFSIM